MAGDSSGILFASWLLLLLLFSIIMLAPWKGVKSGLSSSILGELSPLFAWSSIILRVSMSPEAWPSSIILMAFWVMSSSSCASVTVMVLKAAPFGCCCWPCFWVVCLKSSGIRVVGGGGTNLARLVVLLASLWVSELWLVAFESVSPGAPLGAGVV